MKNKQDPTKGWTKAYLKKRMKDLEITHVNDDDVTGVKKNPQNFHNKYKKS